MTKPFLGAFNGEPSRRVPFWFMRQAGRYLPEYRKLREDAKDFLGFCYTPDLTVEATLQPLRRFGMDAAILFSDILVIPDALGQDVAFREGEGPVLEPVRGVADIAKLRIDRVTEHLEPVFETVRRLAREIPDKTALIGFAGAPWTVAVYMVEGRGGTDCAKVRRWTSEAPEDFAGLIDLLVEATIRYLVQQVKNGAEAIQLFDTWAGLLDEDAFERWVIRPTAAIVEGLNAACPGVPVIGFPRGVGTRYADFVAGTGVAGVSIDCELSLTWARDTLQPHALVQGNLDNQLLLGGGAAMERQTERILDTLGGGPFVFNLGHGIVPATPPEHVARVAEIIRSWRRPAPA